MLAVVLAKHIPITRIMFLVMLLLLQVSFPMTNRSLSDGREAYKLVILARRELRRGTEATQTSSPATEKNPSPRLRLSAKKVKNEHKHKKGNFFSLDLVVLKMIINRFP